MCAEFVRHALNARTEGICHALPFGMATIGKTLIVTQGNFESFCQIDATVTRKQDTTAANIVQRILDRSAIASFDGINKPLAKLRRIFLEQPNQAISRLIA